jgi:hypothetical protein
MILTIFIIYIIISYIINYFILKYILMPQLINNPYYELQFGDVRTDMMVIWLLSPLSLILNCIFLLLDLIEYIFNYFKEIMF